MRFSIQREALLEPLATVATVVERRQTLPILANVLLEVSGDGLTITGTDQEVELSASVSGLTGAQPGTTTIPARKAVDIWRSLPAGASVDCELTGNRVGISSGRFKSHLVTLPAADFPTVVMEADAIGFSIGADVLAGLLARSSFAMAQQDVRYFFNGLLMEVMPDQLRVVATNGQRLATAWTSMAAPVAEAGQFIIPRKGVIELSRVLPSDDTSVDLRFSTNHVRVVTDKATLTSKLIDGTYPDYGRAIPTGGDKILVGDRREIREALSRAAILSNEMYRNVRLSLAAGRLDVHANNPLQEEAEETVSVDYDGDEMEIGFNVNYLIDALGVMSGARVSMQFTDASSAVLMRDLDDEHSQFVISPMML